MSNEIYILATFRDGKHDELLNVEPFNYLESAKLALCQSEGDFNIYDRITVDIRGNYCYGRYVICRRWM